MKLGTKKTIIWLLRDFSIKSIFFILFYYFKKRTNMINSKKEFLIVFRFNGKNIKIFLRENEDDFSILREIFLYGSYFRKELKDESMQSIFDIGAHIGTSVLFFNALYPKSKIFCFEPSLSSRQMLKKNLAINGVDAFIFPFAVGVEGKINFLFDEKNSSLSTGLKDLKNCEVESKSINSFFDFLGRKEIDLLKCDIEGGEIALFENYNNDTKIKNVLCEVHPHFYSGNKDIYSVLERKKFKLLNKKYSKDCYILFAKPE